MAKVLLEFNLPEEHDRFLTAARSREIEAAIVALNKWLLDEICYSDSESDREAYLNCHDMMRSLLCEHERDILD